MREFQKAGWRNAKAALLILLIATLLPLAAAAEPPPEIRVLVIDSVDSVSIEGSGQALRSLSNSRREEERHGASVKITAGASGLVIAGADRGAEITFTCGARRYRIGQRKFRGELTVLWREKGKLMVVNRLPLEDYLVGLINSEISSSWPAESIKAQAVAARTYAMSQMNASRRSQTFRLYDITGTTLDQVYDGAHQEDYRSRDAVGQTRGQLLTRGGSVFPAFYHSCCGGRTERATNVWPGETGPPVVDDRWCSRSPKLKWSFEIPVERFIAEMRRAGIRISSVRSLATSILPDSPRNEMLLIEDDEGLKTVLATTMRKVLGYKNVKSTWFEVELKNKNIVFTGRGYGHGVGLCQWGAKSMAEAGHSYREILKFYYPDAEISTLY